jgi:hypothetical protein
MLFYVARSRYSLTTQCLAAYKSEKGGGMSKKGRSSILLLGSLVVCLICIPLAFLAFGAKLDRGPLNNRMALLQATATASPNALQNRYRTARERILPILPPDPDYKLNPSGGIIAFDPANFSWAEALEPAELNGVTVYPVTVAEDPETRYTAFYNGSAVLIGYLPPEQDYFPFTWLADRHPEYYAENADPDATAWAEAIYDPARVSVTYYLLPVDDVETMAEAQLAAQQPEFQLNMNMMLGEGLPEPVTNLVIFAIEKATNGMALGIGWPDDFTNKLEVFARSTIATSGWFVASSNLSTAGTNSLWWTDTSLSTNDVARFYSVGNADLDSDGDGIADARERKVSGTDESEVDTDGDGLVDGYSGKVTTNSYPAGARTNGGVYVEGEMTWGTDLHLADTDGDGMGDGWEVANGHDPLDPNDPPNVSGTVIYDGEQVGTIWVVAVTSSNSWSTNHCDVLSALGTYRIKNLSATNYWLKAWLDTNVNGTADYPEAVGLLSGDPILITNRLTGANITLSDPDNDSDGLPDWWEIARFGGVTNWNGSGDPDDDQYTNLEEYEAGTDPLNTLSHPWNISGTISYIGPQTGTIYVVACTAATEWVAVQCVTLATPGAYVITHLPPDKDYWIRAWRDSIGNESPDFGEAWGDSQDNPVSLNDNVEAVDVTLEDDDSDGDSLPDWWEVLYGFDPYNGGGGNAAAWWKLNAASGTNMQDSTSHGNNGVLFNAGTNAWTVGVLSNALSFDGADDFVQIPDSASLKPDLVSVSLWVKPAHDYTNGTATFFSKKQSGGSTGYRLSYEQGALSFLVSASGGKSVSLPCNLSSGVWHHVVGTYGGPHQRLYVDGVMVAQTNYSWGTGFGYIEQDTTTPRIGASTGSTASNFFAGVIDDVQVYSGELASNQVWGIYEPGSDGDGDGLYARQEYEIGTSPTDPNDPPNVLGMVSYTGMQTGSIRVLAATGATDWIGVRTVTLSTPGAYHLADLPPSAYWIKAYRDSDADDACDSWEASGLFSNNPLVVTGQVTGVALALGDPDLDGDGMADWQEMAIVNASTNDALETIDHVLDWADFDGDGISNGDEMRLGTDPNNNNSIPPVLRFSVAQVTASESASNAVISMTLLPAAPDTVQVFLSVVGGSSQTGTDYAFTNQIVTVSPAETNRTINIPIMVDAPGEPVESIELGLSALTGPAVMGPPNRMAVLIADSFADSDSDGLPDAWEIQFFGNLNMGAGDDPDGDGVNNLAEFRQGRHPLTGAAADTNNILKLNVITPLR